MSLVNINQILTQALKKHYAILHANVISYDMTKAVILAANQACAPIIVAVSEKALQGFADPKDFVLLVKNILNHYKIKIPVAIHLDHGSYNVVLQAIQSGFTSVMYDGSKLALQENLKCTKKIVALAHKKNISVECEVGTVLGKLEDVNIQGQLATVEECKLMAQTGINALAAGIGNLHGKYPPNWEGLNFQRLQEIHQALPNMPLVLHGGSGIPQDQIKKAIKLGVCKFNVGTELMTSFSDALQKYFTGGGYKQAHGYDPRNYLPLGYQQIQNTIIEKIKFLGSYNKYK